MKASSTSCLHFSVPLVLSEVLQCIVTLHDELVTGRLIPAWLDNTWVTAAAMWGDGDHPLLQLRVCTFGFVQIGMKASGWCST